MWQWYPGGVNDFFFDDMTHYAFAFGGNVLWAGILIHFLREFFARRNPISGAIAVLVGFVMMLGFSPFWMLHNPVDLRLMLHVNEIIVLVIVGNFYFCLWRARKFKRTRSDDRAAPRTP